MPPRAIEQLRPGRDIDLVFSDVVMPGGMSGFDLARWVREHAPTVPVLLTSGFAEDVARAGETPAPGPGGPAQALFGRRPRPRPAQGPRTEVVCNWTATSRSYRGLSPASSPLQAPEQTERWIPATSAGMTARCGQRARPILRRGSGSVAPGGPPSPTGRGGKRPRQRTRSYMTMAPAMATLTQKLDGDAHHVVAAREQLRRQSCPAPVPARRPRAADGGSSAGRPPRPAAPRRPAGSPRAASARSMLAQL